MNDWRNQLQDIEFRRLSIVEVGKGVPKEIADNRKTWYKIRRVIANDSQHNPHMHRHVGQGARLAGSFHGVHGGLTLNQLEYSR